MSSKGHECIEVVSKIRKSSLCSEMMWSSELGVCVEFMTDMFPKNRSVAFNTIWACRIRYNDWDVIEGILGRCFEKCIVGEIKARAGYDRPYQ